MKKHKTFPNPIESIKWFQSDAKRIFNFLLIGMMIFLFSCQKEESNNIKLAGDISLSVSVQDIVLTQKNAKNSALTFNWTTGTNNGTGAAISYILQMDIAGNNFANPHVFDMGKGIYTKDFSVANLNASLLEEYGLVAGSPANLETRVIASIHSTPPNEQISEVMAIDITPHLPVSTTLYLIGDASPNGLDADNAIALTPDSDDSTIFVYRGKLGVGNYKFITTPGELLPSYNLGTDANHIVYRTSNDEPDNEFTVTELGMYKITVSLLDFTITSVKLELPAYENIYMVGDATPNGWDISNATALTQDLDNPYIFTYMGVMNVGDFKLPVNQNSDWAQDMYMRLSDSEMYLHNGGDPDDNKWSIAKKGYYFIKINLMDNSILRQRTKLYMVGSATPIGWSIDQAIEMVEDDTDGCIFTYSGPMVAGEFKFPVNRNTDWGQDMYMPLDDTYMYRHVGGAADDNKWIITTDGDYEITANVETLIISIIGK